MLDNIRLIISGTTTVMLLILIIANKRLNFRATLDEKKEEQNTSE